MLFQANQVLVRVDAADFSISTSTLACRLRIDRSGPEIWSADNKPVATW